MANEKIEQFWGTFGKISAVATVIATILGIWINLKPDAVKLTASAMTATIAVPPDYISVISILHKSNSREALGKSIFNGQNIQIQKENANSLISKISDSLQDSLPDDFKYATPTYNGYCNMEIRNDGTMPAVECALYFPFDALSQITFPNQEERIAQVRRSLQLGILRPGEKMRVQLWLRSPFSALNENDIVLSHKTGKGKISFSATVFGFSAWIGRNLFYIVLFAFLLILITVMSIFERCRNTVPDHDSDELTPDTDTPE